MTDLLTRLEQATGGSRELSDEVLRVSGWTEAETASDPLGTNRPIFHAVWLSPDGEIVEQRPCPTTSLDAKLPWEDIRSSRYLFVEKLWEARHFEPLGDQGSDGGFWIGKAKTEILARRIAALRARG